VVNNVRKLSADQSFGIAKPAPIAAVFSRGNEGRQMTARLLGCVAAAAFVVLTSAGASAQNRSAVTGDELETILSEAGFPVQVVEDARTGAPVATVQVGEIQYWIRALDCKGAPKSCSTLVFFANFSLGRAKEQKDFEIINRFNDSQLFGRAYLLPGRDEVGVDYVIELDGGVSLDHIAKNIARWSDVIDAFIAHFSDSQKSS
jgi:hypothetical protein